MLTDHYIMITTYTFIHLFKRLHKLGTQIVGESAEKTMKALRSLMCCPRHATQARVSI